MARLPGAEEPLRGPPPGPGRGGVLRRRYGVLMEIRELSSEDCHLAYPAMRALRTGLRDEQEFVTRVRAQLQRGYRLVGVFDDGTPEALSVAGFHLGENLAWGAHCYLEDLSTLPEARGRGGATMLLDWLTEEAAGRGATEIHLESGVQAERQDAHRLYFAAGMRISSYHFSKRLSGA